MTDRDWEDDDEPAGSARERVAGPALALLITAGIWTGLLVLGILFNLFLLASGAADKLPPPRTISKETQVAIRMGWEVLMLAANVAILVGAVKMKGLRSLGWARAACILSLIPCLGPCFVVGLPFGIWGLSVLGDPRVRRAFRRPPRG